MEVIQKRTEISKWENLVAYVVERDDVNIAAVRENVISEGSDQLRIENVIIVAEVEFVEFVGERAKNELFFKPITITTN